MQMQSLKKILSPIALATALVFAAGRFGQFNPDDAG